MQIWIVILFLKNCQPVKLRNIRSCSSQMSSWVVVIEVVEEVSLCYDSTYRYVCLNNFNDFYRGKYNRLRGTRENKKKIEIWVSSTVVQLESDCK